MANSFITNYLKNNAIRGAIEDANNEQFYLFIGKASNTSIVDTDKQIVIDTYRNMTFGKKVDAVVATVLNNEYVLNTKYNMYDDTVVSENSYAMVKEGSNYYVYRCLDNNFGANSTVKPNYAAIVGSEDEPFRLSDGYLWKYLYTVSEDDFDKYGTTKYFPVLSTERDEQANTGKLEVIKIENDGLGYRNYITGTFSGADLYIDGERDIFNISNSSVISVNGFYTGCLLYITSGANVGEYRRVVDYITNSNGNFMYLNSELNGLVNGITYELYPQVLVYDNNVETDVIARAIPSQASGNAITRVEILSSPYDLVNLSANVVANDVVEVTSVATLRPISSPHGGHGYDVLNELRSNTVCFYTRLANTESNTILANISFDQIGLLRNPLYSNVMIETANAEGSFVAGENVYSVKLLQIASGTTTVDDATVTLSNFSTTENLVNQWLVLQTANASVTQIAKLASVTNSTSIELATNAYFSESVSVYLANVQSKMVFKSDDGVPNIFVDRVTNPLSSGDYLVGFTSGATAYVNAISRNDMFKGFNTFVEATKYRVTTVTGSFVEDETITVGNNTAKFAGYRDDGTNKYVYLYDNLNTFLDGEDILGSTSGTTASIVEVYRPELAFGSGDILYVENIAEVTRNNSNEVVKLYLQC